MASPNSDRLRAIKTLSSLVAYLRDELDWPIDSEDVEDITFDYTAVELGLAAEAAVRIKEIKQLRPLSGQQPWGIFWVNFEKKRLPVVVMRLILRALVLKKRADASRADRQAWAAHDLLFISAYGEESDRAVSFAHFVEQPGSNLAELRVLGWDDDDTPLHMDYVARMLREKLCWDEKLASQPEEWRQRWSDAFLLRHRHVVRTSQELAVTLASLAQRIRSRIRTVLHSEDGFGEMRKLQSAFRTGLIHDLDDEGFADMFAQTVTYGLFSLAVRRTVPGNGTAFTKDDLPHYFTSPFLTEMLGVFLGIKSRKGAIDFDELGVSDVTDLLTSPDTHMEVVLADFNNKTRGEDPVIHFYEHFLSAYNKQLKIQRGVFYTPQPVVSYIVRSVHELLQTEFGLTDGLADTTTWGEMLKKHPGLKLPPLTDEPGEKRTISPDEPFVQILDPATFLVEVIDVIHRTLAAKWKQQRLTDAQQHAAWNDYVPQHLLPRLHAFELMMAPYAIAHMKVGLKLAETGYRFGTEERARIYLTNALEPKVKQLPQIGFDALAHEAAAVNEIKWYKRFTVVIGNPPYSNFGQLNRIPFILTLLDDYKRGLDERKINLDDDFIKFVRLSQYQIDRTGAGIFGMITNNSFLDGVTHRQMRQSLGISYQRIAILNLHGSATLGETCSDGSPDENVFDIRQGVGVTFGVKRCSLIQKPLELEHADLWGTRDSKYAALGQMVINKAAVVCLPIVPPYFFFVPKDFGHRAEYEQGIPLKEVFQENNTGIQTKRDSLTIQIEREELRQALTDIITLPEVVLRARYELPEDGRDWQVSSAKADVGRKIDEERIRRILYRPFDWRWTYFTGRTKGFLAYPRRETSKHMLHQNLALVTLRINGSEDEFVMLTTNCLIEKGSLPRGNYSFFPLYLYSDNQESQKTLGLHGERRPNFGPSFTRTICAMFGLSAKGSSGLPAGLTPEDIFHYAYAVFHSPGYRGRYAEFLKIDFPRLPLTGNLELFRALARLGGELTALHLLESPKLAQPITEFIGSRHPEVEKISWSRDTVWVDKAQTTGFQGVREDVWNFHIGGYQVCEKWLKDRKGRTLTKNDLAHYQKIVVALSETIRLMAEIDKAIEQRGGWPGAFTPSTLAPK